MGVGGGISIDGAFFGVTQNRMRYYHLLGQPEAKSATLLSTNDAVQRALLLLSRVGQTDSSDLRPMTIVDYDAEAERRKTKPRIPGVIAVEWGALQARAKSKYATPETSVTMLKQGGLVLRLRLEGARAAARAPELRIRDVEMLLKIPDGDFLKLSPQERASLFKQTTGRECPHWLLDRPDLDRFLRTLLDVGGSSPLPTSSLNAAPALSR